MNDYAELEIRLQRGYLASYSVELRFTQPDSDDEKDLTPEDAAPLQFDFLRLRELAVSPADYGRALTASLFSGWVAEAFTAARRSAQELGAPLRVRLFIAPSAAELHGLRWETLADPQHGEPLLADQAIWFSRYLSS